MKKILLSLAIAPLFSLNVMALDYVKGSKVKEDVPPRLLRNYIRKGKGMIGSARIVISKDAVIPKKFEETFKQMKLTGETVPTVGAQSDDVIFIKSF